ncbi:hypothetical protein FWH13_01115 [Candidatus Saccharibacteria bacterium]|nr:hypothetical protein [Candidatus Saccharibacteria bacterium]
MHTEVEQGVKEAPQVDPAILKAEQEIPKEKKDRADKIVKKIAKDFGSAIKKLADT